MVDHTPLIRIVRRGQKGMGVTCHTSRDVTQTGHFGLGGDYRWETDAWKPMPNVINTQPAA
jgi:hypothetical protein